MGQLVVLVACVAGCGRIAFDPHDGLDCWAAWHSGAPVFAAVEQIAELADPDKQGNPWLSADGRTLYFDSGTTDTELYRVSRAEPGARFGPREHVAELASPSEDTGLVIAADDRLGVYASTRSGSQGFDLWQVERPAPGAAFGAPTQAPFAAINDAANQFDGFLTPDGLTVYYSASTGPSTQHLRFARRAARSDVFAPSEIVPGSGTLAVEADPEVSPDERVLVFAVDVPLRLQAAVRASRTDAFSAPFPLPSVVAGGYDGDPTISADGCELIFVSDRGGDRDLYRVTLDR